MRAPHNGPCGKTLTCRPLHLRHRLKYRAVPAQFALSGAPNLKLRRILPAIACTAPSEVSQIQNGCGSTSPEDPKSTNTTTPPPFAVRPIIIMSLPSTCLFYTSDDADESRGVTLGEHR